MARDAKGFTEINLDDVQGLIAKANAFNSKRSNEDGNDKSERKQSGKQSTRKEDEGFEDDDEGHWDGREDEGSEEDGLETELSSEVNDDDDETEDGEGERNNSRAPRGKSRSRDNDGGAEEALAESQRQVAELRRQLTARQAEVEAEKQVSTVARKRTLEAQRDSLNGDLKSIKASLKKAKDEGDTEAEVDLTEKLQKQTLRHMAVENALEDIGDVKPTDKKKSDDTDAGVGPTPPREAVKFAQRNKALMSAPPGVRQMLAAQAQILVDDDMDPNTPEFYEELAVATQRALDASGLGDKFKVNGATPKKRGSPVNVKERSTETDQKAKANAQFYRKDGKLVARATRDDVQMAQTLGVDLKAYMQKKHGRSKIGPSNWKEIGE